MVRVGVLCGALCLTDPAMPDVLTVNIWPGTDPDQVVFCTLSLSQGQFSVIEAKGLGLQNPHPLRWWAAPTDVQAFGRTLQALQSGAAAASHNPLLSPRPAPPFLTVTWLATQGGATTSGRYSATDLPLPAQVAQLLETVMPGSYCSANALH